MTDIIIVAVLLVIVALAAGYIIKAKKSGQKCIGCSACKECSSKGEKSKEGTCSCGCQGR